MISMLLLLAQPSFAEAPKVTVSGDVRFRQELSLIRPGDARPRWRARLRARVGVKAELFKGFDAGARLRTGNPDDPNSPYRDLGAMWDSFEFGLDRAYVKYAPGGGKSWIIGGKFAHPFTRAAVFRDFLWDEDVNPEGMAAHIHLVGEEDKAIAWDFNLAGYTTLENATSEEGWLFAGQSVIAISFGDSKLSLANAAYVVPDTEPGDSAALLDDNNGNALNAKGNAYAENFAAIDTLLIANLKLGDQKIDASARFVVNAAAAEQNLGWQVGIGVPFKVKKVGINPYVDVHGMQREAFWSALVQDDHQLAVGYTGATAGLNVRPYKNLSVNTFAIVEAPDDPGDDDPALNVRGRIDVSAGF